MSIHHNTKQKAVILDVLQKNSNHVTAEDIISLLSASGEKVGRATVYRYLRELEFAGRVKKYTLGEKNTAYYQYMHENSDCSGHYHLMCDVCGSLEHLDPSVSSLFEKSALDNFGFVIDRSRSVFYGKCNNCR